jgi:exodeoxyribonuclease V alpha subunit
MIGDPNQLPSVSAGNVLADLIASETVPLFRLTQIFRQGAHSLIVENAHRILEGRMPEFGGADQPGADFFFFPADDALAAAERTVDVVTERIPRQFGLDWARDVQVLAPMYRGDCGVDALNERLRAALGHAGHELSLRGRVWRTGDRVIHTRNDYEKEIFNGDMGRITRIEPDGSGLTVKYPERHVGYTKAELSDLQPAFAITVHRSQGGEFPAVVLPLVTNHYLMLQRHLLYTAVTRARKLVVLVGSIRALRMAVENAEQRERKSGLAARLRSQAG